MDDNFWYDEVEITGEWRLDYIFQNASSVYRKIINSCSSNYLKLQPYEMTKIYYHILYEHYVFSAGVLRKIVREIENMLLAPQDEPIKVEDSEEKNKEEMYYNGRKLEVVI